MKKYLAYLLILTAMVMAVSCKPGFKKTKSGLLYKIITDGKNPVVKRGEFVKLNYIQKIGDSVLISSYDHVPGYARIDSMGPVYNAAEIFYMFRKGDSAIVVELVDSLKRKFGQLPPFFKKRDKMTVAFKVEDVFPTQDLVVKDRENEFKKERSREDKVLADYIAEHHINAQKTPAGTYVEIKSVGDGPAVDSGKQVGLMYTGRSFPDGKVFESNITGPKKDTLKFVVGKRAMIQGMDDGVKLFRKGGTGILYLPAYLAYDAQAGPNHKPYESLIFEIQVVDVTNAPIEQPKPKIPMQQQLTPEQLQKLQQQAQKASGK